MKRPLATSVAVAALAALSVTTVGQGSTAAVRPLSATMTTKQVVTVKNKPWKPPAKVANARGAFTGSLDTKTRKLRWRITFSGIGNAALPIGDVHVGPRGKFGAIIVRLCAPCKSGQRGVKTVKRGFVDDVLTGNSWVTVITEDYPNGVIRGQIEAR